MNETENQNYNCDVVLPIVSVIDSECCQAIMDYDRVSLEDWQKQQPLSILQLDTADRVVLRVAGMNFNKIRLCHIYIERLPGS